MEINIKLPLIPVFSAISWMPSCFEKKKNAFYKKGLVRKRPWKK